MANPPQTQGYLSLEVSEQCAEAVAKLDLERRDELVEKCVHAIIVLANDNNPIKKSDISRLVFSSVNNYRVVNGIIHLANEELQDTYGLKLYMIDGKFFLVNVDLGYQNYQRPTTDEENEELTLLYFILTEIFVNVDERSTFEEIEKTLAPFELKPDDKNGGLKFFIDKFLKQMYIGTTKYQETTFYVWGPRAYAEVDLDLFFKSFLLVAKEDDPKAWPDIVKRVERMKKLQQTVGL